MKNFRHLDVWKRGFQISLNAYTIVKSFSTEFKWDLGKQITRAAVSIPSNIAEGCSRSSEKDCNRFFEIALGSSYELETQLLISRELNLGQKALIDQTIDLLISEQKMISSFSKYLRGHVG
jgi:four helix bundle protein